MVRIGTGWRRESASPAASLTMVLGFASYRGLIRLLPRASSCPGRAMKLMMVVSRWMSRRWWRVHGGVVKSVLSVPWTFHCSSPHHDPVFSSSTLHVCNGHRAPLENLIADNSQRNRESGTGEVETGNHPSLSFVRDLFLSSIFRHLFVNHSSPDLPLFPNLTSPLGHGDGLISEPSNDFG